MISSQRRTYDRAGYVGGGGCCGRIGVSRNGKHDCVDVDDEDKDGNESDGNDGRIQAKSRLVQLAMTACGKKKNASASHRLHVHHKSAQSNFRGIMISYEYRFD